MRWMRWAAICLVGLGIRGCQREAGVSLSPAACDQLAMVEANRSRDVSDAEAVRKLAEVVPKELLDEVALFYYPLGGSVDGLETSGTNAEVRPRTASFAQRLRSVGRTGSVSPVPEDRVTGARNCSHPLRVIRLSMLA